MDLEMVLIGLSVHSIQQFGAYRNQSSACRSSTRSISSRRLDNDIDTPTWRNLFIVHLPQRRVVDRTVLEPMDVQVNSRCPSPRVRALPKQSARRLRVMPHLGCAARTK